MNKKNCDTCGNFIRRGIWCYDNCYNSSKWIPKSEKDNKLKGEYTMNKNSTKECEHMFVTVGGKCIKCDMTLAESLAEENTQLISDIPEKDMSTISKIDHLFDNFSEFLKEKNRRYGNSALEPIKIFSQLDVDNSIYQRLDDKLSRIKNSTELKKNDCSDLFGYIALLMISKNWLDFDDLLD